MAQPNKDHFSHPPAPNKFLSIKEKSYTYRDLYYFTRVFRAKLPADDNPLLVFTESRAETVFVIAASFLIEKPVIPVSPNIEARRLQDICDKLSPSAFFSTKPRNEACLTALTHIQADPDHTDQEDDLGQESGQLDSFSHPQIHAGFFHTSGSTSSPKIVPIKRRQFFTAAYASKQNFKPARNKYWLLCLPLNHIGGISVIIRSLLYHSAIYLVPGFNENSIKSLLNNNQQFEAASMVPTMLERLLDDPFFRVQFNFKALLLGGGPISTELINKSLTRGIPIVTSYGMTETCAQIAANPMLRSGGMYIPKKSVGNVFRPNEIEIRDDNGNALPYLESGHIWLKGPQVFDGYLDHELNRSAFDSEGWFHTGDYGHLNRKKHLFIESRRTDLIISGGENISPAEVEEALKNLDHIYDAAVVGVPDHEWGQKSVAFIQADSEVLKDVNMLRTKLKRSLQSFKVPKEFVKIDIIPKTATGKIKRNELRKLYTKIRN